MTEKIVLDSFALVCLFHKEAGWQTIQKILYDLSTSNRKALLNIVNWGEFYYIVKRRVGSEKTLEALNLLEHLPIETYPLDKPLVMAAADLKAEYAISYADAFCIATAQRFKGKILTNDPEFKEIDHLVKIIWLDKKG